MKILLIGEYSGFHRNLAFGLKSLGHSVEVAGYRDGWKQISVDFDFGPQGRGVRDIIGRVKHLPSHYFFDRYADKFDLIQLINPVIFPIYFNYNKIVMERIIRLNVPKVLIAAGDDAYTWSISRRSMRYHPWDAWVKEDLKLDNPNKLYWARKDIKSWCEHVASNVDAIIPVMYEYDIAYKWAEKKSSVIPLPVVLEEINYNENIKVGKLNVFHGLNRPGFKGTSLVIEAFNELEKKYAACANFEIKGKMPYDQYLRFMSAVNVVIDQVRSYSHGLNGLIAMASGKIVLGGSEPESLMFYEHKTSPAINVLPDVADIVEKISNLIDSDIDHVKLGEESRAFVVANHDSIKIAEKYLAVYRKIGVQSK